MAKRRFRAASMAFRLGDSGLEVLLVKPASGKHWRLPRQRVRKRQLPRETAALAAYRKAGVTGCLSTNSIGVTWSSSTGHPS